MTDSHGHDGPPPFDDPFDGDVEQRIYGVVLGTREPTGASTIAERADCDPKTARKYLRWFAELGIVTEHEGRPRTYERNDAYFEWRRVDRLAAEHSIEELQQRVSELTDRIRAYEEEYGTSTPGAVDALDVARAEQGKDVDEVYADLGDWASAWHERRRYERARQQRAGTPRQASG